jgi:hypothetical protein
MSMQHQVLIRSHHILSPGIKLPFWWLHLINAPHRAQTPSTSSSSRRQSRFVDTDLLQVQAMEGFVQKHVVGVPLTSFAYADEERRGKPSCSAMVHKKSKNLATCFPASSSSFARKKKRERERRRRKLSVPILT